MGGVEHLLTAWGVAAVFAGAMAEGESVVLAGGALAQRGLFPAWQVALAAFAGSVTMDQLCFLAGRRFRDHRGVLAIRGKPVFRRALGFVERYPNGYIVAFRYLYGLRIVSPLAIGISRIAAMRFVVLNVASAAVWAILFTALGYAASDAFERVFGRVHSAEIYLLGLLVAVALVGLGVSAAHRLRQRRAG